MPKIRTLAALAATAVSLGVVPSALAHTDSVGNANGNPMMNECAAMIEVLRWMFFEQNNHEPNIAVARFWRIAGLDPGPNELEARRQGGQAALRAMEAHLTDHEFFVANRYTIADIALYAYTHVAPEGGFELDGYPAINAWLTRVRSQPGHVPITD
jgi:glutathione S-transferase